MPQPHDDRTEVKLDAILEKVSRIEATQAREEERHAALEKRVDDHGTTLYGNGQPGLKAQVQSNTETLGRFKAVAGWGAGILATVIGVGAVWAVTTLVRADAQQTPPAATQPAKGP